MRRFRRISQRFKAVVQLRAEQWPAGGDFIPDIELNMFWTNLGWSDDDVIASYHAHGECEQYHSELKTDMDAERLPSGKFAANALVLELAMIAFNLLRMIGQECPPPPVIPGPR